jgi:hypothetical protein
MRKPPFAPLLLTGRLLPRSSRNTKASGRLAMEHILEQLKIQDDVTAEEIAKTGKK